jgi:hypothetical protein
VPEQLQTNFCVGLTVPRRIAAPEELTEPILRMTKGWREKERLYQLRRSSGGGIRDLARRSRPRFIATGLTEAALNPAIVSDNLQ